MEMLIEKATQAAPAQTIRLEQAPMVISPSVTSQERIMEKKGNVW